MKLRKMFILVICLLVALGSFRLVKSYFHKDIPETVENYRKEMQNVNENNTEYEKLIKEQHKTIEKLSDELNKYKIKEKEEELKKERIKALQNPEIIQKEMSKVSKLVTYEGKIEYNDVITKKSIFKDTELCINIKFKYGFGIDLNEVIIDSFIEDTVILQIPKDKIKLLYIETIDTSIDEIKKFLGKEYEAEEVNCILNKICKNIRKSLNSDIKLRDKSMQNLKDDLEKIILKLGYKRVIFEEI